MLQLVSKQYFCYAAFVCYPLQILPLVLEILLISLCYKKKQQENGEMYSL